MLFLGVAAGFVWQLWAQPAEWEVRETGLVLTEAASKGQFSVIVLFVLIGAVVSLVWGWFAAWALPELGWLLTPFIVVLTLLAAVLAWRLGVALGPPDPASVPDVAIGDRVPAELEVDGLAPFLTWPIFGLLGLVGCTWLSRHHHPDQGPDPA
jgi:hypothetical protein